MDSMSWDGAAWSKALQGDNILSRPDRLRSSIQFFSDHGFKIGRFNRDPSINDDIRRGRFCAGSQGQFRTRLVADNIGHRVAGIAQSDDFQMSGL